MNFDCVKKAALDSGCVVLENELMSRHTTFKIGGPARLFITAARTDALAEVITACRKNNVPYFVVGNGSDLLVSDSGINTAVISLGGDFKAIQLVDDTSVFCGAGASLASLCSFAYANSLTGLEFAWGIPASVGGAAYMNAGAYGGEMKDVIESVSFVDENGKEGKFDLSECDYGYRHSVFTDKNYIITGIKIRLNRSIQTEIKERMDDFMTRRKTKQPLEYPSAGSVFKRPEGYFAGALIEGSGLKGLSEGGAQVSEKHAGFIINTGNATCKDVETLINRIKQRVLADSGVQLECEVKRIGDDLRNE